MTYFNSRENTEKAMSRLIEKLKHTILNNRYVKSKIQKRGGGYLRKGRKGRNAKGKS